MKCFKLLSFFIIGFLCFCLLGEGQALASNSGTSSFVLGSPFYNLNGSIQKMDVAPYIKNGRVYLPIRYLANAIGIPNDNIIWDAQANTITLMKGDKVVQMKIGINTMLVNGAQVFMDVAPEITAGRTFLPARFVAEAFNYTVRWDASTQTIDLNVDNSANNQTPIGVQSNPVTPSPTNNANVSNDNAVVYDDFTGPLSEKWDISNAHGSWTTSPGYGAYCAGRGWLPLKPEFITSQNFTIECEVGFWNWSADTPQEAGVLLFYNGNTEFPPTVSFMGHLGLDKKTYYGQYVHTDAFNWKNDQHIYTDKNAWTTYILKIEVKGNTVDVYLDNDYVFSSVVKEEEKGNSFGLYTERGGYIKNFKLTNN